MFIVETNLFKPNYSYGFTKDGKYNFVKIRSFALAIKLVSSDVFTKYLTIAN